MDLEYAFFRKSSQTALRIILKRGKIRSTTANAGLSPKDNGGASERQAMEGLLGSLLTGTSPPGAVGGLRERRMRAMRTRRSFFVVHLYASQNGEPCTAAGFPVFDGVLQDRSEAA